MLIYKVISNHGNYSLEKTEDNFLTLCKINISEPMK